MHLSIFDSPVLYWLELSILGNQFMKDKLSFSDFKLNKQLINAITDLEYAEPTEIQKKAIPLVTAGQDVLGIAQTGTGKTAAFALPILMKVKYAKDLTPRALVLAPTRELVMQIEQNFQELAKYTDIRILAVYGGIGPKTQIEMLQKGVDILVATPGRFLDIYSKGELITKQIKTMVLDEADKIMDMGFMPQIRNILEVIPVKRQNLLFSATFPPRVEELSFEFLDFPEKVEVAPQATTVDTVSQCVYFTPNFLTKVNLLFHLLEDEQVFNRVIIFANTRATADNLFKFLGRKAEGEIRVIHANKGQNTRINSIEDFKAGGIRILVATDVSARGIDVSMVSHVINFDVPPIYEDYVHRIGRTGRAKQNGIAITFANDLENHHLEKIEVIIDKKIPVAQIPEAVKIEKTPFIEQQQVARALDNIKKKADPDYKGAFHEKKKKNDHSKDKAKGSKNKETGKKFSKGSRRKRR